jgi:DNA polymerase III delta prime subunit
MNEQLQQFTRQLENGRLAQSFLVSGPEKTGKFRTVVKMTGALNGLTQEQIKLVYKGEMTDIILIETEISKQQGKDDRQKSSPLQDTSTSNTKDKRTGKPKGIITKKQIDSAMKNVNLKNFQLKKKVIIIKDANKMTNTAANSLLKLIEEPSNNLVIFLLVNNENDILATIKSRCQVVRFSFTGEERINEIIQEEYPKSKELLPIIVDLAGGRIELARQYADNPKKIKLAQKIRNDFREALRGGKLEQIKLVDKLVKDNEDLLWVMNEWIWYLKFFLEKNIQGGQPVAVIKKVHAILKNLLKTRDLIRTTNSSKKVQLENFFVQV